MIIGLITGIVKAIGNVLFLVFKIIYAFCKALKIRLLALYLLVCLVFRMIRGPFVGQTIVFFWVGVGICLVFTVAGWYFRFREKQKRRRLKQAARDEKKRQKKQALPEAEEEKPKSYGEEAKRGRGYEEGYLDGLRAAFSKGSEERGGSSPLPANEYPKYYDAAGHEGYLFVEYENRYELYFKGPHGWEYVRTDPK